MISLELAKKLKEAGLEWEPKMYDFFAMTILEKPLITCVTDKWTLDSVRKEVLEFKEERRLFLPRLDQLLAEIEKLEYSWDLAATHNYKSKPYLIDGHVCIVFKTEDQGKCSKKYDRQFYANSPTEATASALLWIIERRDQHES